jgi:gliding motility-associated protein GldM
MSGGNCPETPRQKMIGMMYLFLTAMLALNVSGELLQAFKLVDKSIQQNIKAVDSKKDQLYAKLDQAKLENEKKAGKAHSVAHEIEVKADNLFNHITELKLLMVHTVDNPEATLDNYVGSDNQDVAAQIMITEQGGQRSKDLKSMMNEYRDFLQEVIGEEEADSVLRKAINESLSTEPIKSESKGEISMKPWESTKFEHLPLSASFALMSGIQSNVRATQADVVSFLLSEIDEGTFKFNKVEAFVIPNSNYILQGDEYYAEVLLAARDTLQPPTFDIPGKNPELINGRGVIRQKENSVGTKSWKGTVIMRGPDGKDRTYPVEHEYTVMQPSVVISPTKMNVFYESVENPVMISVPGVASSELSVNPSNNINLRKVGKDYIVTPKPGNAGRKATITVSASGRRIGSSEFRIKRVPNPVAMVAGKMDGNIAKNLLLAQGAVFAEMGEDFDFDLEFKVTRFTVSVIKDGYVQDASSTSNRFTEDQRELIGGMSRGSKIYIENISAVGPDNTPRKLNTITFTLN